MASRLADQQFFPNEQAALKCVYMAIMSLDPTGKGQTRWTLRWKTALNAFDGRLSAARQYPPPPLLHRSIDRPQGTGEEPLLCRIGRRGRGGHPGAISSARPVPRAMALNLSGNDRSSSRYAFQTTFLASPR